MPIKSKVQSFKLKQAPLTTVMTQKGLTPFRNYRINKVDIQGIFRPKLHYLDVYIEHDGHQTHTRALVDSGCAKTVMSFKLYNNMPRKPNLKQTNAHIQTCDGTTHGIKGTFKTKLMIGKRQIIEIYIDIMVVDGLADDLLLGLDFLGSDMVGKITPTAIYVWMPNEETEVKEKFIETIYPTLPLKITKEIDILPNTLLTYNTTVLYFNQDQIRIIPHPMITILDSKIKDGNIQLQIANTTDETISFPARAAIAKIQTTDRIIDASMDEYLEDKELAEKGYHKPSITNYIENRTMITEAEYEKISPEEITDEDFLNLFDLRHFDDFHKEYFYNILLRSRPAFAMHKYDIGKTHLIEMDIELNGNHTRIQKMIPMPLHVREKARDILDQMKRYGIIRECNEPSPYCSNILVIPKKDNVSVRLLFDGRLLNYDTVRYPMALVTKPEILAELANKKHLSSLDVADAFYQIPLTKKAQPLTAFYSHTHGIRMCFNRAPQGLRNSPLYLKLLLDIIFKDMQQEVMYYADDLLIATNGTMTEHLDTIHEVLQRLMNAGLKLRPEKLLLARHSIEFLGMIFDRGAVQIPPLRLDAFRNIPSPTTAKRLKSALCAFSYYRHFVPHFATLTNELMTLANGPPKQFKFTEQHEKAFRDLIKIICDNSTTYFPDKNLPFYVQTDASKYCAGGRIFQVKEPDETPRKEMLIAAVSKTFTTTERNYSIYKKEALSLLYTLRAMDFYLRFAPKLIILVDSKALTFLRLAKDSSDILLRFSLEISKYEAEIHHVPGTENEISDMLSRQHEDIPTIEANINAHKTLSVKDSLKIIEALTVPNNFRLTKSELFNLLTGPSPIDDTDTKPRAKSKALQGKKNVKMTPITKHNRRIRMPRTTNSRYRPGVLLKANALTRATARIARKDAMPITEGGDTQAPDDRLADIPSPPIEKQTEQSVEILEYSDIGQRIRLTQQGLLSKEEFHDTQLRDEHIMDKMKKKNASKTIDGIIHLKEGDIWKPALPAILTQPLAIIHHFQKPGIHKSAQQILRDITNIYSIPRNVALGAINKVISDCHICQIFDSKPTPQNINTLHREYLPRQTWSIDFITDLPRSRKNSKYLLLCVDDFANFIVTIPLASTSTSDIIEGLTRHLFTPFGIPAVIRSDEQPGIYNSADFFQFFQRLGIRLLATAVASPASNGRAERTIGIFKKTARKYYFQNNCIDEWDDHLFYVTTALNASINSYGFSPEQIMFGYKTNDFLLIDIPINSDITDDQVSNLITKASEIRQKYNIQKQAKEKANLTFRNKDLPGKTFTKGDLVLHRQLQLSTGIGTKWQPTQTGPYLVVETSTNNHTVTCQHIHTGKFIKAHFTNLTPYKVDTHNLTVPDSTTATDTMYK